VSGRYVIGLEGDADWTNISYSASASGLTAGGIPQGGGGVAMSEKTDFLGSIRARAGFLLGDALVYATGGVAWAQEKFSGTEFYPNPAIGTSLAFSQIPTGWVAGAGVEYLFKPNWLLRAEFLYYGFSGATSTVLTVPLTEFHPANTYGYGSSNIGVARAGLSYKFN
jgi:outer membrane immunogenic protein